MTAHIYAMTDTWNDPAVMWRGDAMNIVDTGHAAGSTVMRRSVNDNQIFALGPNGHAAFGTGSEIDYYDYFGEFRPITINVTENVGDISTSQYMMAGTINYTPTADNTGNYVFLFAPALYIPPTVNKHLLGGIGCQYSLYDANQGTTDLMYGSNAGLTKDGGSITNMYVALDSVMALNANVTNMWGHIVQPAFNGTSHVSNVFAVGADPAAFGGAWSVDNYYGFWHADLTQLNHITNPYYFWSDGPGVFRIKEDGAVKGAVPAGYNPAFTKYTAGAPNAERWVLQWATGNIVEIGAEAIGTGTLRKLRLLQNGLLVPNTPTADPHVAGQVWANSGVLTLSAG